LGLIVPELPCILRLTENHLKEQETESFSIDHYTFGAKFGRKILKKGGTSIFVHESLTFTNINLQKSFIEQDTEVRAVKINLY
jgi:hypothetical protein